MFTRTMIAIAMVLISPMAAPTSSVEAQDRMTLTISAASDLTPAFTEVGDLFGQGTGISVEFNFGSTGQLTEQIKAGAPVDVFAAANVSYIDELESEGLIFPDSKALYARGRIVLWTRAGSELSIATLDDLTRPEVERIAIANPDHAPYGVAAREALQSAGIWDSIQSKLVLGENISDTLRYAETGNVDVAIVALSLAIQSDGAWTPIPEEMHAPLDQALAVVKSTRHEAEARRFARFVNEDTKAREIMSSYGFVLPGENAVTGTLVASPMPESTGS